MHKVQSTSNPINSQLCNEYMYKVLVLLIIVGLLLISYKALAADPNPFTTPDDFSAASCPIGHKKYSIGNNASTATTQPLSLWEAGETSRTFNFNEGSDNKTFTIKFPILIDLDNSNGTVPFYGSNNGFSSNAINLVHNSTRVQTDHSLDISVNRPVSKIGYKIQDLDSTTTGFFLRRTPYIEQVDVSATNGQLTFNNIFHNINAQKNIVTAKEGENCDTNQCTIDATWGYKSANNVVNLKHSNEKRETSGSHAIGYSDFYFCLAPPKLIVKKELTGTRVNDTNTNPDQFELSINRGTTVVNAVTTTGSGSAITNNDSRNAVSLAESTSYMITERVRNGTTLGEIANYNATYTCTNATTGSTTVMPTTAMTYNATDKTRSFTLSNATYGDEITCTITNTPKSYTFSGTVFNDNGGISNANAENADITNNTSPYANNTNYFNGIFDITVPQENGIAGSTVKLVNCTTPSIEYATQAVSSTGTYQITASATTINSNSNNICLAEERSDSNNNTYPIRTTSASKIISIVSNIFNYPNNNFGRVIPANAALVLEKEQAPNNCNITSLTDSSLKYSKSPLSSSGDNPDIRPGQCIAYRITATNRANMPIDNFIMQDILQLKGINNATVTSVLTNPAREANVFNDGLSNGQNGTIKTISQTLPKTNKRLFYFNTKYGSTVNAQ